MHKHTLIPAVFFLAGSLLILLLVAASLRTDTDRILLETEVTAEQISLRLGSCINSRAELVNTLAAIRWENTEKLRADWNERASTLYPLQSGILALNFIDTDWFIRNIYPSTGNQAALNADLHLNPNSSVVSALGQAESSGALTRTDKIELLQSGTGIAMYKPIFSVSGEALGFANGVFRLENLMESCLTEAPLRDRFVFRVVEADDRTLYQQPADNFRLAPDYTVNNSISVLDRPWLLEFSPSASYLERQDTWITEIWAVLGMLLLMLLTWVVRALLLKQNTLQTSQEKYRLLVENQNDMVVKVNANGEFLYVSPSYCATFGVSEEALVGQNFLPLVHEDDRELTQNSLQLLHKAPHRSYHEQRAMTKAGWRWLAWSNTALFDQDGKLEAITAVGRDVTEIKSLEARVSHAQKMQAIGNMAGGITHDFNNLLQVILGNIEFLMLENRSNDNLQKQLTKVSHAVERAMTLTARLSTLSRQETSSREVFEINHFIEELLTLLRRIMPANIEIHLHKSAGTLHVNADKTQIEQVILNLCLNARDAIGSRGIIDISVNTSKSPFLPEISVEGAKGAGYVCILVADNGAGIAEAVLPHIFDPFFTTKNKGSGTGLGLANSYSIVRQHLGEILVESEVGKGSVFSVYLPLGVQKEAVIAPASEVAAAQDPQPGSRNAGLILVVDDDPDIQQLTCAMLDHAGFTTVAAGNGQEALYCVQNMKADISLVIMDLLMPVLGGKEAADELSVTHPEIKVLFVSAYIPHEGEELKRRTLRKPFTRETLIKTVRELLA